MGARAELVPATLPASISAYEMRVSYCVIAAAGVPWCQWGTVPRLGVCIMSNTYRVGRGATPAERERAASRRAAAVNRRAERAEREAYRLALSAAAATAPAGVTR